MDFPNLFSILVALVLLHVTPTSFAEDIERTPYIVYLGESSRTLTTVTAVHHDLLTLVIGNQGIARKSMIHSYYKSFNAFAARLLPEEAERLMGMNDVLTVFPNTVYKLHSTRSWDFMGFPQNVRRSIKESNVVIGLLDTGISPHSRSFEDKGFGPPPKNWRGKCSSSSNFTCNNKLIGARYYHLVDDVITPDVKSPADTEGHGTHTASIAAGSSVAHASLFNLAGGTARGAVPAARIAMYKVCWADGCHSIDMLAAFDDAIHDRVGIISASIGGFPEDYFADVLSIGSFHAMKKGILTCMSAGNEGPMEMSVSNVAPWAFTVAATSMDRQFRTTVKLGNGKKVRGISLNTFATKKKMYPLITGASAGENSGESAGYCMDGSLEKKMVKGKVVWCYSGFQPEYTVKSLGGAGLLVQSDGQLVDVALTYPLPTATMHHKVSRVLTSYMNSTKNPYVSIYKSKPINVSVPFVASFSARGPNPISVNILKPDIAAPGLDILGAWTPSTSITGYHKDKRMSDYNVVSGTSMACPHVSGAAAYVKSFHPRWSPAAIKSAIMTTAKQMRQGKKKNTEFAFGSGLLDPVAAIDPGLIYDLDEASYLQFLCKEGYDSTKLRIMEGNKRINCTKPTRLSVDGLNYPSMQLTINNTDAQVSATFRRRVTNVGQPKVVYTPIVRAPRGMSVSVRPEKLVFRRRGQKRSFKVVVGVEPMRKTDMLSGSVVWSDSKHRVRSPIVVTKNMIRF